MSDLIQQFRQEHIQVVDQSQVQWCREQYKKERIKLVNLLKDYDCDIEGFPEYMRALTEMANVKAYPSLRTDYDTALDFKRYHELVYQIYDQHYHSN
jgi:hypothetical protein